MTCNETVVLNVMHVQFVQSELSYESDAADGMLHLFEKIMCG